MRVALVDTIDKQDGDGMPNVALASLAGYLRAHGHETAVLDLYHASAREQEQFFATPWGLLGITATSFAFPVCQEVVEAVRAVNPHLPIVVGGAHPSVARAELLATPGIDYGVHGEGEITLLELVTALEESPHPTPERLSAIPGLIFRGESGTVVTPDRPRITALDQLPLPYYDDFPMELYPALPIFTSRGCPFACVFCAAPAILGRAWAAKSPERVVEELELLVRRWGKTRFHVVDDTFNLREERVRRICQLLIDRNLAISWSACGIRADKTDPAMLDMMKAAGCVGVSVGVESANPAVLKSIGKGETLAKIDAGIRRIKAAGIPVNGMFMIGNPGDTLETVRESIRFARSAPLDRVNFYHAMPYPGTKLWEHARTEGRMLRGDYQNFQDFVVDPIFETATFSAAERAQAYQEATAVITAYRPWWSRLWSELARRWGEFSQRIAAEGVIPALGGAVRRTWRKVTSRGAAPPDPPPPAPAGDDKRVTTRGSRIV